MTCLPVTALATAFVSRSVLAGEKRVKIGIDVSLTGAGAEDAILVKNGAMMAIEEVNATGGVAGYSIEAMVLDDGTATAGQYDPAQAATNARKMVSDPDVVAAVGPQNSGCGKAMAPICDTEPTYAKYTKHYAPDTNAARFWLLNRRRDQWKERHEVAVSDPLASLTPEQRLAQVVEIMAKARALLAANPEPDDVTDAEYEETGK